jgi:hypothetical protein
MWLATHLHPTLSMYLHPSKWTDDPEMQAALKAKTEIRVAELFDIIDTELANQAARGCSAARTPRSTPMPSRCAGGRVEWPGPGVSWPHFGLYARRVLEGPAVRRALQQEHLSEPWI